MLYRKIPVCVEAFQLGVDEEVPDWFMNNIMNRKCILYKNDLTPEISAVIQTLEGEMTANYKDYIIKGVKGEIYPCKPDIFELTYEKA